VRILVTVAPAGLSTSHSLTFSLVDGDEKREVKTVFVPGVAK
jgi:hypothetical protein